MFNLGRRGFIALIGGAVAAWPVATAFRPLPFSPISRGPEAYWLMGQIYSACIG
jgi:hypothetical protein